MIADDGSPILMDFGSTMKARIKIENRSQALLQQVRGLHSANGMSCDGFLYRISPQSKVQWPTGPPNCSM